MIHRNLRKKIAAALMALCMLSLTALPASAETLADIQAEQARLAEEKTQLEARLEELENDEAQKVEYQQALQDRIAVVEKQIDSSRASIETLNKSINQLSAKLEESQQQIQETFDTFKARIATIYKSGDVGTLEILLSATSFSDFSMKSELLKGISKHDQELMEKIKVYMDDTKEERAAQKAQQAEVAELQKTQEASQAELTQLQAQNEAAIAELQQAQVDTEATIAENEAQGQAAISRAEQLIAEAKAREEQARQEAEARAEEARRQEELRRQQEQEAAADGSGSSDGGSSDGSGSTDSGSSDSGYIEDPTGGFVSNGFSPCWPIPGVTYISCHYGSGGHRGLDIAGDYGTPIVAADAGTVIEANDYDSWGDSWGYYVLIYHNGTYTTRYAHLSSLAVSQGQTVSQGQIIGYEGSTGNSTGPHLHFEIYENGTRVNPEPFLGL